MKKIFKSVLMAVTAIAITGFWSCNKGDSPAPSDEERPATLNITLENPSLTRVAGDAPGTGTTVTDYSIFVLDEGGSARWKEYVEVSSQAMLTKAMEVTTAAKAVYVIANAGSDQTGNYKNKTELESANPLVNLDEQYTSRWATGSEDGTGWTFQTADSDGNGRLEEHITVRLKFIAARIVVTVDNNMNGYDGTTDGTVKISDVAVLNARGQSRLFPGTGTSLIPSSYNPGASKYIEGFADNSFAHYPAAGDYTVEGADDDELNSPYTYNGADTPTKSHFYVFESDAMTEQEFPTIVTLVGTAVDGATPVYFPVHLAPYETWASNTTNYAGGIVRGNSYNITITLNGDATLGTGGGASDPTVSLKNVDLMATIEIADWTPVPLGKNF